ncbi:MAG: sodium/proline symporter [Gammaproteobacteria bacterium]|nr:sodium/proline symporter [Gammaproteobacteria bacterium]MYD81295.1 sodium/proline symporter [Gammaproteobacteria bacterium]
MYELLPSFIGYLLVLVMIAIYAGTRTSNMNDYSIGGRSLSSSVTALSAGASDMSGWLLLGLPGAIYVAGLVESWILVGLVVGAWINWTYVANRLRVASTLYGDAITIPQFLALRTGATSKSLAIVASIALIVFFTVYVSAGFVASAKLFESVLGIEYMWGLLVGVAVVMTYTAIGGFLAVSWTDTFQALLMMVVLVAVPTIALSFDFNVDPSLGEATVEATQNTWNWGAYSILGVIGLLAWGLGYFGQPHILARFMAIREANAMHSARAIGMSWMVLSSVGAVAVGYAAIVLFPVLPDGELALIVLSEVVLSPWIAGIVVAAILAAVMSTVDSQLMVVSTVLVNDVVNPQAKQLLLSRGCVIAVALVAASFALDPNSRIFDIVSLAWAGIGSSFGSCVIFSLFYRGTTSKSLIAAIVTGMVVTITWHYLKGGIFDIYELLPAFGLASLALYVVARMFPEPAANDLFERLEDRLGLRATP